MTPKTFITKGKEWYTYDYHSSDPNLVRPSTKDIYYEVINSKGEIAYAKWVYGIPIGSGGCFHTHFFDIEMNLWYNNGDCIGWRPCKNQKKAKEFMAPLIHKYQIECDKILGITDKKMPNMSVDNALKIALQQIKIVEQIYEHQNCSDREKLSAFMIEKCLINLINLNK